MKILLIAAGLAFGCMHSISPSRLDLARSRVESSDAEAANLVLHVTYAIKGVAGATTSEEYLIVEDQPASLRAAMKEIRADGSYETIRPMVEELSKEQIIGSWSVTIADGVSTKTGRGIGASGGYGMTARSEGIVLSFKYQWKLDEDTGSLQEDILVPYSGTIEVNRGRLSLKVHCEWKGQMAQRNDPPNSSPAAGSE